MRRIVVTFPVFLSAFFLTACSLFDSEVPVRDLAYDVRSEIAWNAEHMAYTLRLSLESGEDGDYIFEIRQLTRPKMFVFITPASKYFFSNLKNVNLPE